MRQHQLSRRAVLAGGAVVLALAGCSAPDGTRPPARVPDSPEQALARTLIADKQRTIAFYTTLITKGGDSLTPWRARHAAHLAELQRRFPELASGVGGPASPPAPPSASAPASAPASPPVPVSPGATAKVTLSRLRALERRSAALRTRQLADVAPSLAQLVASIGACEALHAPATVKLPPPAAVSGSADMALLRRVLAAEHAAIFAYGLLGARTSGSLRTRLTRAFDDHRDRRDQLRALITAGGGRPSEPEPSYSLPSVPSTAAAASRLAAHVETGLTAAYLELVAAADPGLRQYAALGMQEAAIRASGFVSGTVTAFPGMPGSATPKPTG